VSFFSPRRCVGPIYRVGLDEGLPCKGTQHVLRLFIAGAYIKLTHLVYVFLDGFTYILKEKYLNKLVVLIFDA